MSKHLCILLTLLCVYCNPKKSETKKSISQGDLKSLQGHWVLTNYLDNIVQSKAIEKHTKDPLSFSAIILTISSGNMRYYGLINPYQKEKLYPDYDSLITIKHWHHYQLSYDRTSDKIMGVFVGGKKNTTDSIKYTFRRIRKNELKLVKGIEDKDWHPIKTFHPFFIEQLISGKYKALNKDSQAPFMTLDTMGKMRGFKKYNKYHIHSYFMTNHPFRPEDAIIFEDTLKKNRPLHKSVVYSWAFRQDTLILTEMHTQSHEQWSKGTKTYTFIKQ